MHVAKRRADDVFGAAYDGDPKRVRENWMGPPQRGEKRDANAQIGGPAKKIQRLPVSEYFRKQILSGSVSLDFAFGFAMTWANEQIYSPDRLKILTDSKLDASRKNVEAVVAAIFDSITIGPEGLIFK